MLYVCVTIEVRHNRRKQYYKNPINKSLSHITAFLIGFYFFNLIHLKYL